MWIYEIWRVFSCSSNLFCPIPQMGLPFPITVLSVAILLFLFTFYARATLPSYSSSNGQLTGVFHPSSHPSHNGGLATSLKRPNSQSGSSHSQSFRLKSDLSSRCSWKFVAIFFMLFSFLLITALIYTAGKVLIVLYYYIININDIIDLQTTTNTFEYLFCSFKLLQCRNWIRNWLCSS